MVFQFDRPSLGGGAIQAFRRSESPFEAGRFRLQGLDPNATYELTDLDSGTATTESGQVLRDDGLPIAVPSVASSTVIEYRRKQL
jgi:alpha-galactosidase